MSEYGYEITEDDYDYCVLDGKEVDFECLLETLSNYSMGEIIEAMYNYDQRFPKKVIREANLRF